MSEPQSNIIDMIVPETPEGIIQESEDHLRGLFDNMLEGYAYCRMVYENDVPSDWIYLMVNKSFEKHTGLNDVIDKWVTQIIPHIREDDPELFELFNRVASTGNAEKVEIFVKSLNKWLSIYAYSIERGYFTTVFEDITTRKLYENELKIALKEKEILLKEIHHRVKNNLQVVSSLLNIQSGYVEDTQSKEYFRISADRVKAMSLIHEHLYKSINLSQINFENYVNDLVIHLYKINCINPEIIEIKVDVPGIVMDIDSAMPCGLVINEIVSNSFKHAFPGNRKGKIKIELKLKDENYALKISDNGVGMPVNAEENQSLGTQLIKMLSEQLDATTEIRIKKGTEYIIEFKSLAYRKRI